MSLITDIQSELVAYKREMDELVQKALSNTGEKNIADIVASAIAHQQRLETLYKKYNVHR